MRDGDAPSKRARRGAAWLPWALVGLAACGGGGGGDPTGPTSTGGASTSSGGSGGAGAAGGTAATGGMGGAGNTGGAGGASTTTSTTTSGGGECDMLLADLTAKLDAAKACSGASNQECQAFVEGLCCPEVVAEKDAPATQTYLDALAAYQQAGCSFDCPAEPCPDANKGLCSAGDCIPFN
jgi:hypothetical protein